MDVVLLHDIPLHKCLRSRKHNIGKMSKSTASNTRFTSCEETQWELAKGEIQHLKSSVSKLLRVEYDENETNNSRLHMERHVTECIRRTP